MRTTTRLLITLVMVAIAVAAGIWLWNYYMYTPWTRDGRVRADITTIAPDVSGWVSELAVHDNDTVQKGDLLFGINDARFKAAYAQAEATALSRKYTWKQNLQEYQRRKSLPANAISAEDLATARINAEIAKANYQQAEAQLESARIDLERSEVRAPADGSIINLQLRQGNYVSRGNAAMSLVQAGSFYVTGYFEETKIPAIDIGDKVDVWLMSGKKRLEGHVTNIGRGISNANTSPDNQLLPQVQPTFTWVRLAQRIPVDIALDKVPDDVYLSAGMTATVRVQAKDRDDSNVLPAGDAPNGIGRDESDALPANNVH
ncbi:efflux RND transporter periplasmic adaptor subunit [Phytohalomonas tamaricis]|uniref:efflux RND transporter periplasmic adaptor subunit n=1 Tax=Phytohalomonas tamaricis TaxID=2081032 RepID=UPI000D0BD566|nr:HlyD family secretion protein [Phytohalomonas tamaricis]